MTSHDPLIVAAENTLLRYQRHMRELTGENVPRGWVADLLGELERVLDAYADVVVELEPPGYDEDYDPNPYLEDEYIEEEANWPFTGDGDHSDERGNG